MPLPLQILGHISLYTDSGTLGAMAAGSEDTLDKLLSEKAKEYEWTAYCFKCLMEYEWPQGEGTTASS